jgi:ABC-type multidrug transport system fused ATPase/permease subunit
VNLSEPTSPASQPPPATRARAGALAKLRQIYFLLDRAEKRHLALLLGLMLLATVIEVVGVGSIYPLLQILATPEKFAESAIAGHLARIGLASTRDISLFLTAVFAIFLVLSNLVSVLVNSESARFAWNNWRNVSIRAFDHYLRQPYPFFFNRNSAELTKLVTNDTVFLGDDVVLPFLQFVAKLLVIVALGLTLLIFDPVITLALLAFFSIAYGGFSLYSNRVVERHARVSQTGRTASTQVVAEALRGIKEIKSLDREEHFVTEFRREVRAVPQAEKSIFTLRTSPRYYLEAITIVFVLGGLAIAIHRDADMAALVSSVGLFVVAGYRLLPLFSQGFMSFTTLMARLTTVDDLLADLRTRDTAPAPPPASTDPLPANAAIALSDVTYAYPGASAPALKSVSLLLEPGTKVGLLGTSGGGKSTLIDVLLTLLEPQQGNVRVGEVAIDRLNARWLRQRIGYVPQAIFIADDTVLGNIAFGVSHDCVDMKAVVRAATQSNIHEFIAALPQGYRTLVGERGMRLSGGQRQRLGIARALYADPPVIVFDEATSALDTETETAVMDALHRLEQKTIVMVAHRLSTLRQCDAVYEVSDGRLSYLGDGDVVARRGREWQTRPVQAVARWTVRTRRAHPAVGAD